MEEQSTFDRLVLNLSKGERKDLLEKIQSEEGKVVDPTPLRRARDATPINYTRAYEQLGFIERLILFLKVLFTEASREEALEQLILTKLGKSIEREHPDMYEYESNQLLSSFSTYVQKMKERLAFMREPYSKAFGTKKQDFFAFMVGWRFPEIQERLLRDIEPEQVAYEKSLEDPHLVKKEIEYRLEDIIGSIGQEQRELLYNEARHFNTLYHLVFFSFDRILSQFVRNDAKKRYQVSLNEVREALNDLAQVLFTLQDPPSEGMIKILFIFHLQKELETESSQDIDSHLTELLNAADAAFNHIRYFNERVPLLDILRFSKRNLEYVPTELGGGEDWFVLFKQFWYRRFEGKIKAFTQEQKRKKLIEDAKEVLKAGEMPQIQYYDGKEWESAGTPRYHQSIGFVRGFVEKHFFGDMHGPLKLILIDGEFYKEQNRDEYNEAYNAMLKINDELDALEHELSPDGDIGKKVERIRSETASRKQVEQKVSKILGEIDKRVEQMISRTIDHLTCLYNIIDGILYGDVGGRYDTLSNLGYIGRNENKNLSKKLSAIKTRIASLLQVLTDLFDTERQL